jgi:hypothetical protein
MFNKKIIIITVQKGSLDKFMFLKSFIFNQGGFYDILIRSSNLSKYQIRIRLLCNAGTKCYFYMVYLTLCIIFDLKMSISKKVI